MNKNLSILLLLILFTDSASCQDFDGMGGALAIVFLLLCFAAIITIVPPLCFLIFIVTPKAKESIFWIATLFLGLMLPFLWAASTPAEGSRNLSAIVAALQSGDTSFLAFDIIKLCIRAALMFDILLFMAALRVCLKRRSIKGM